MKLSIEILGRSFTLEWTAGRAASEAGGELGDALGVPTTASGDCSGTSDWDYPGRQRFGWW
ncbi:MAG TPA: hypothetical protein VK735_39865 [Pseudonocardia sp.]|uniref:hypothetical protein n=1 Tax=Pseudonocardia sp. TaxID=60912 RepID=UPI002D02A1DE|nr:hypothetical protein [Pseudonocardia sp.]HTF53641.1 hypothetical protein [Pseudonocardia sp.]